MADKDDYLIGPPPGSYAYLIQTRTPPVPRRMPTYPDPSTVLDRLKGNLPDLAVGGRDIIYNSYAGVDISAQILLPRDEPLVLGELQTISYSIHRENTPVRFLGSTNPSGFVKGPRTIAGSLIFTNFNNYAFYRLRQFQTAIEHNLYPVADMLPPFDVILTFANESGVFSKMKIYGVTIVDEGGTMSIDDLITESTYTYMARGIQPLTGFAIPGNPPDRVHTINPGG